MLGLVDQHIPLIHSRLPELISTVAPELEYVTSSPSAPRGGRAIGNACRKRGRSLLRGGCVSSSTGRRAQRASTFCDRIIGILDSHRRMP